jgi:hypothetical protein
MLSVEIQTDVSEEHVTLLATSRWLVVLFIDPKSGGDMFLRNVGLTFNGLNGVISHNI